MIRRAMGIEIPETQQAEAFDFFLKYYRAHSLEHTRLYDGVGDLVTKLTSDNHRLGVLTNKPERISLDILGALGIGRHFFRVYGGNSLPEKKPNPIGILKMMEETDVPAAATLMVGDSSVDIQTARNAQVKSCGVTWGFQPETFETTAPDMMIGTPGELVRVVNDLDS